MSDMNDHRDGGLFSDDYELPKRENPYKKKKKVPADKAEAYVPTEDKPYESAEVTSSPPSREAETYEEAPRKGLRARWNDFMFAHVKLICFIGGVILVLLFISAPAIYDAAVDAQKQAELQSKPPLTLTYLHGLADKTSPITWSDLVSFPYDETVTSNSVTWMLEVQDTDYEIWISGANTQVLPTYVYLYDMATGERVDLTEGSFALEAFLSGKE